MSTAGKVLSVLVALTAVVWMILIATVAQLNRNGAQAVENLVRQVAKLEDEVNATTQSFNDLRTLVDQQQRNAQTDLTNLQIRQSSVEGRRAEAIETVSRVRLQMADVETMLKLAGTQSERRLADKNLETKQIGDLQAEVEAAKGRNQELMSRLTSLRDKFAATLKENQSLAERLLKNSARPAPSS